MAAARELTTKTSSADKKEKKKKLRNALWAVVIIFLAVTAAGWGLYFAGKLLFDANPRLVLREIKVSGSGYWKEHASELAAAIGLEEGQNLFSLDLKKIREKLCQVPSIENSSVYRVLPDTLIIRVTERAPRAFINRENSAMVADGNTVIMPRRQAMAPGRLPLLLGVNTSQMEAGKPLKQIAPAMEFIMTAVRNYPDITIYRIYLQNPKKLHIYLRYRKFSINHLVIPVKNRGMAFMLMAYQSAVINAHRMGEKRNNYDLSYDGRCVIR